MNNFYFISNVCTGDYLNKFYGIKHLSPLCVSATDEYDFIKLIDNFENIDFYDRQIIQYNQVKVIKKGYYQTGANKVYNVDTDLTFAYSYKLLNSNDRIEVFYRHYELNQKNQDKIDRRIKRVKTIQQKPFFILQFTRRMLNILGYSKLKDICTRFYSSYAEKRQPSSEVAMNRH